MKRILFFNNPINPFNAVCIFQVDFIWGKQMGSDQDDKTRNLVADTSRNVYVVGKILGKLGERRFCTNKLFRGR